MMVAGLRYMMETKIYTKEDLTPCNQTKLMLGLIEPNKKYLITEKRKYCYTIKYKGGQVLFKHEDKLIKLI